MMISREDYELRKHVKELREREYANTHNKWEENDELIIEDNTIYEIDLECYDCMMKKKHKS